MMPKGSKIAEIEFLVAKTFTTARCAVARDLRRLTFDSNNSC